MTECPFCGARVDDDGNGRVICNNAECIMGAEWIDQTGCESSWNTRPIEDKLREALQKEREALLEVCESLVAHWDSGHILTTGLFTDCRDHIKRLKGECDE